jgi:hypothetical protein
MVGHTSSTTVIFTVKKKNQVKKLVLSHPSRGEGAMIFLGIYKVIAHVSLVAFWQQLQANPPCGRNFKGTGSPFHGFGRS